MVAAVLGGVVDKDGITVAQIDQSAVPVIPEIALIDGNAQCFFTPDQGAEIAVGKRDTAMGAGEGKRKSDVFIHDLIYSVLYDC